MTENEHFEVLINGTWRKVELAGAAKDYSLNLLWIGLQKEYGYENVRLVKDIGA